MNKMYSPPQKFFSGEPQKVGKCCIIAVEPPIKFARSNVRNYDTLCIQSYTSLLQANYVHVERMKFLSHERYLLLCKSTELLRIEWQSLYS